MIVYDKQSAGGFLAMVWQYDANLQRFSATLDGWHALVQRARQPSRWRAGVAPLQPGVGHIAPAVFASPRAAQAWCIGVIRQQKESQPDDG
jgi:hypothetical protein